MRSGTPFHTLLIRQTALRKLRLLTPSLTREGQIEIVAKVQPQFEA